MLMRESALISIATARITQACEQFLQAVARIHFYASCNRLVNFNFLVVLQQCRCVMLTAHSHMPLQQLFQLTGVLRHRYRRL
jgi:hypothetical protein